MLLVKLQRSAMAILVAEMRKQPPLLPFLPSTEFVTFTSCSRTRTPMLKKTAASPFPLLLSNLRWQVRVRNQSQPSHCAQQKVPEVRPIMRL